jgi:hypothetical protein
MAGGIDRYPAMRGSERESLVLQRKKGGERRFCRWGQGDKLTVQLVAGLLGGRVGGVGCHTGLQCRGGVIF